MLVLHTSTSAAYVQEDGDQLSQLNQADESTTFIALLAGCYIPLYTSVCTLAGR